jgi:hypothetical protein
MGSPNWDESRQPRWPAGQSVGGEWRGGGPNWNVSEDEAQKVIEDDMLLSAPTGAKREDLPIKGGIRPGAKTQGFGSCVQLTLENAKAGEEAHVGYAVRKVKFAEAVAMYRKDPTINVAIISTEAFPHAWNVVGGQIADHAMGSSDAKDHIYFGLRVPSEKLSGMTPDDLVNWQSSQTPKRK